MTGQAKILIIDDDKDFVKATKVVLETNNYTIIAAHNGQDGLKKAREESPDLIILDIIMPVKDGFSTAGQFKEDPQLSKIPILILTSFGARQAETTLPASEGMKLMTEDYIEKPVRPEELLKVVEKILGTS